MKKRCKNINKIKKKKMMKVSTMMMRMMEKRVKMRITHKKMRVEMNHI
jgi:hypothetical protein